MGVQREKKRGKGAGRGQPKKEIWRSATKAIGLGKCGEKNKSQRVKGGGGVGRWKTSVN